MESVERLRKQLKEKYCLCLGELSLEALIYGLSKTDKEKLKLTGRSYDTGKLKSETIYVKDLLI